LRDRLERKREREGEGEKKFSEDFFDAKKWKEKTVGSAMIGSRFQEL